jgi:hypothetical protein
MKRYISIVLFLSIAIFHTSFTSVNESWEEAYTKNETIIYTRTTESGIKEFKAITTMNVSMKTILAVMVDYKSHPDWMRAMKDCELVQQVTPRTRYLYYSIDMPWPLWDRDLVSKSTFYPQKNGSVLMKMQATPTVKSNDEDHVRIIDSEGYWLVTPISSNKTKIVYQYKADPVGIPSTLVNMFLLEAPKASFEGLASQVKLSKYQNPNLDWLYK